MVAGSADTYRTLGAHVALASGATVVVVDYWLAPEARWPTQVRQADAVVTWAAGGGLGSGRPVVVAGDSAGGNLAAVATRHAARAGIDLAGQVLIYPITDATLTRPSTVTNGDGYYLTTG